MIMLVALAIAAVLGLSAPIAQTKKILTTRAYESSG
jgi:hypothetical protein